MTSQDEVKAQIVAKEIQHKTLLREKAAHSLSRKGELLVVAGLLVAYLLILVFSDSFLSRETARIASAALSAVLPLYILLIVFFLGQVKRIDSRIDALVKIIAEKA